MPIDVLYMREADLLSFAFNITELHRKIDFRNYSVSYDLIEQTFESSYFVANFSIPKNYSCHVDENCHEKEYKISNMKLNDITYTNEVDLKDVIHFFI